MSINASDIKMLESEVMADTTDGGGRRTSRVIPDGVAGNIFPKVSRLDSVYGRVNLRKVYGAVQTANVDTYAGSHAIITDAPDNPRIHTTLFSTGSEFDTRTSARDRIESYVTSGPESRLVLLGRQLPGQQTFMAYQRVEESLPEVGTVYCLSNEPDSIVTTQQYVRVQDVSHEVRTFEDVNGTFQRRVVTVDVGVALRYEFNGPASASRYSDVARTARLRDTTVVDAARYFGIKKLAVAANQNDLQVQVESVYTAIVPTTNRETPIASQRISESANLVPASSNSLSESVTIGWPIGATRYTSRGIAPGSLTVSGGDVAAVGDDKQGNLSNASFVARVDYESGAITRTGGVGGGGNVTITYIPAAVTAQPSHTLDIPVSLNNRGMVYPLTLNPLPSPGTVIIDYRALGKWYRLRDTRAGSISGADAAYGGGSIDYASGALAVTLGALPDVGSSLIVSWGSPTHYTVRSGATSNAATNIRQSIALPDLPVNPDSVSITYTSAGVDYTATDNAAGTITGNGLSGSINYTTGLLDLEYTIRLPDSATQVTVTYQQITPADVEVPIVVSLSTTSSVTTDLGGAIVAGSLIGSLNFTGGMNDIDFSGNLVVIDNGSGLLIARGGQRIDTSVQGEALVASDAVIGTINYSTGWVVVTTPVPVQIRSFNPLDAGWDFDTSQSVSVAPGPANWGFKSAAATGSNTARTFNAAFGTSPIRLDLTTTVADHLVPGSLVFSAGGTTFIDRNGTLYTNFLAATGAGTVAGSIDYAAGIAYITHWTSGSSLSLSVAACLSVYGEHTGFEFFFRTPGSPVRAGSLYIQAVDVGGNLLSGGANESGVISGQKISGTINQETGVVRLRFGQMVPAAGHEGEWWFDADNVVTGQIFKPALIQPSTLTFNCVVLSNLPINADVLGLDPVRLPMDGRVPIYREADVVVIHNTQNTVLPNPVSAGSTYSAGRTDLSEVVIVDQAGTKLLDNQYTYNLATGAITMAGDFSPGALVQPLILRHRVEDMGLLSDVQINGQLTLAAPLSRDYNLDSYVSSSLLFGDMNARVSNIHDLLVFAGWLDTIGTGASAQFNNIDFPIAVLNNGAVTERWRINFTTPQAFQVIGENLGVIGTGTTTADCAPANQLTGQPYFVIRADGWGGGWAAGNQLRFNTVSAAAPFWVARTVLPGATLEGDGFSLQMRGDVDAE